MQHHLQTIENASCSIGYMFANSQSRMAGSEEHIKPLRLLDVARDNGFELTEEQGNHLRECVECQYVASVLSHQFSRQRQLYEKGNAA